MEDKKVTSLADLLSVLPDAQWYKDQNCSISSIMDLEDEEKREPLLEELDEEVAVACAPVNEDILEEETMTRDEAVYAILDYWQERMGLSHWQIWVEFVNPAVFESSCYGDIDANRYHLQATIRLHEALPEEHWQWVILHELCHILIGPLELVFHEVLEHQDPTSHCLYDRKFMDNLEPYVNQLVNALIEMKRPRLPELEF